MKEKYAQYLIDKTRADYNLIADEFSSTRDKPWEELKPLFDYYIKSNESVLDLGCGNGRYYEYMAPGVKYTGIDFSEKLIELAKKRYPQASFSVGDVLKLNFPDNSFDKVFSIAVLHHIPSSSLRLKALEEIKRVLKPGGMAMLTAWKFHDKKAVSLLYKNILRKIFSLSRLDFMDILEPWGDRTNRYYHWFSEKEVISLAKKAGFKVQKSGVIQNQRGNRRNIYIVVAK